MTMTKHLKWKVAIQPLFEEVILNKENECFKIPFRIILDLLRQVGERATELNDPKLNALMLRLGLYSISNPKDHEYDPELVTNVLYMLEHKTHKRRK
jgi:hypothetical protein